MITCKLIDLQAAALFCAKDTIRYATHCIHVDSVDGQTRVGASDGCTAIVLGESGHNAEHIRVLIPLATITQLPKIPRGQEHMVQIVDEGETWTIRVAGVSVVFTPETDARPLPFWTILPRELSGEIAPGFMHAYLDRALKALRLVGHARIEAMTIQHNGCSAALVTHKLAPRAVIVIMPYRADPPAPVPAWARAIPTVTEAAEAAASA